MNKQHLLVPEKVRVMILRGESGAYIAELPDFDVHTEADSPAELQFMINDLLYAYFEVPKHLRMFVRYVPEKPEDALGILFPRKHNGFFILKNDTGVWIERIDSVC